MVKPISLRVYQTAVNVRARKLLRELDEKDKQRRRVKWQATKALISIHAMTGFMSLEERNRCRTECEHVQAFLEKIKDCGA